MIINIKGWRLGLGVVLGLRYGVVKGLGFVNQG